MRYRHREQDSSPIFMPTSVRFPSRFINVWGPALVRGGGYHAGIRLEPRAAFTVGTSLLGLSVFDDLIVG